MLADTLGVPSQPHLLKSYTANNGSFWIWFYEALQEALGKDTGWKIRKEPFRAPDNLLPSLSSQHFPRGVCTGANQNWKQWLLHQEPRKPPLQEASLWLGYLPSRAVNKSQCV